jgi:hypothetical protein
MAELVLQIKDHPTKLDEFYNDGDIICAFSDETIQIRHLEYICNIRNFGFTREGYRPFSLASFYLSKIHKYKYSRIADVIVEKNLITQEESILFDSNEEINLDIFFMQKLQSNKHRIFGTPGHEFWFDGAKTYNKNIINSVWDNIENNSKLKRNEYTTFPLSDREKSGYLALHVEDFKNTLESRLQNREYSYIEGCPEFDPEIHPIINYKRRAKIEWRDLGFPSISSILDPNKIIDLRMERIEDLSTIVQYKNRKTIWSTNSRIKL